MSEDLLDKTLVVTSINVVAEVATGDLAYQTTFGELVKNTPEILSRIPINMRELFVGKEIALNYLILIIKTNEVPYKVGSKWKFKINKNGVLSLVEEK